MVKFSDEDKEVKEFNANRFGFGIHKVQIDGVVADNLEDGREYIEVGVIDIETGNKTDNARFWFTGDAVNVSFNEMRRIYVHNAPEEAKAEAGATFDAVKDHTEIAQLFATNLIGGDAWFTVYYDPKRTYAGKDGTPRRSINKNLVGYEPTLKPELMPAPNDGNTAVSAADYPAGDGKLEEPFESGQPAKSGGIPPKGKW